MTELGSFTAFMQTEPTREILERAETSRRDRAGQVPSWLVTDHEDWLFENEGSDRGQAKRTVVNGKSGASAVDVVADHDDEEESLDLDTERLERIMADFREAHPEHRLEVDEKVSHFKVFTLRLPAI